MLWDHIELDELDRQLSPSKSAKDAAGTLARHERDTAALDENPAVSVFRDVPYGDQREQQFDLCVPRTARSAAGRSGSPPSCVVFVHGGFWQEGSKAGAGFAAAELAKNGWATASIGYTLAPQARLRDIVHEAATAVTTLSSRLGTFGVSPKNMILVGHSAGAHLAAAVIAGLDGTKAAHAVAQAILISGVYDLAPIAASYVNEAVGIDQPEQSELSPLFASPLRDVPVRLLIGADEPEAFQLQTSALYNAWKPIVSELTIERVPGRDHFDILDELASRVD